MKCFQQLPCPTAPWDNYGTPWDKTSESEHREGPNLLVMKTLTALAFVVLLSAAALAQASIKPKDLSALVGEKWIGQLTYLDYRSNMPTTIKSNLSVTKKADSAWDFAYEYPDEPKADSTGEVGLSADGRTFNDQAVTSKRKLSGGGIEFVTTREGEDNNKKALFRFTYTLTPKTFSIRKEVQVIGGTEWFERNTYSWSRP